VTLLTQGLENSFHANKTASVTFVDLTAAWDTVMTSIIMTMISNGRSALDTEVESNE